MFKRLREEWLYWRYRNITRRWLLLKSRLRPRWHTPRHTSVGGGYRERGTAMYMSTRRTGGRGLLYLVVAAAVLAVVNTFVTPTYQFPLDVLLLVGMAYLGIQYGGL